MFKRVAREKGTSVEIKNWSHSFDLDQQRVTKTTANKSIANSGAGRWSNRMHIAISFGSGGRSSFEHQNKFLIFE